MENNNSSNSKNIIIGVLVVLVIALGAYIGYDKFLSKENNDRLEQDNSTNNDVVLHVDSNEEKTVEVNEKQIDISMNDSEFVIKNNQKIIIKEVRNLYNSIDLYNEIIVIQYEGPEFSYLKVYDIDGNLLKKIDDNEIANANYIKLVSINDSEMVVNVRNMYETGPRVNDKITLCGCGQCPTSIDSYKNVIDQNRSNFVEATYKVKYTKNDFKYELQNTTQTLGEYLDDAIENNGKWCVDLSN